MDKGKTVLVVVALVLSAALAELAFVLSRPTKPAVNYSKLSVMETKNGVTENGGSISGEKRRGATLRNFSAVEATNTDNTLTAIQTLQTTGRQMKLAIPLRASP